MALPNVMVVQLVNERIFEVTNLLGFDKDNLHHTSNNIHGPVLMVPEPNYIAPVSLTEPPPPVPTILTPLFIFGAKFQKRFLIACDMIQLYDTIVRNVTAANIQWFTL